MKNQITMSRTTGFFVKDSLTDRMYKFIIRKRAVTSAEIEEEFRGQVKKNHIASYLNQILKNGLIMRSNARAQSLKRKCSSHFIYGIDQDSINQKLYSLGKRVNEKELLEGIKKAIFEILQKSDSGFTTSEVLFELREVKQKEDYNNWDYVYTCLRELLKANLIRKSPFMIPDTCMINGRKPGFVYGRDSNAIAKKVVSLMPPEIRDAYLMIAQSDDLYTIDIMEEKFKVTYEQIKSWFDIRLCNIGWIKVYSYKTRRYYYNPRLSQKYVEEQAPKIHETQIVNSILNGMSLGREFQHRHFITLLCILCQDMAYR
jgi:predicted transcriptional regulator